MLNTVSVFILGHFKRLKKCSLCLWQSSYAKDCVAKAYLLTKYKANQSGLATYAGNTMTHMPRSYSAAKSLGHQEIMDDSNCNHV